MPDRFRAYSTHRTRRNRRLSRPRRSCHRPIRNLTHLLADTLAPDITLGQADYSPTYSEWNALNIDANTSGTEAVCYRTATAVAERIAIPASIHRCLYRRHTFQCESGTIACPGNVGHVLLLLKQGETENIVRGTLDQTGSLVWPLNSSQNATRLTAYCSPVVYLGDAERLDIAPDMKLCKFAHRRFICTATPDKHDRFWPQTFSGISE